MKMAALADPKLGRCKYAMEQAREATLKGLLFELKHYDRVYGKFREMLEETKTGSKNPEKLKEEYLKLVLG
jgi:HEPN domain-containing protein